MVTRNIKANTATQVNSNLIGVLVHPNTIPSTVTVNDIIVDYSYTKFDIADCIPKPGVQNPNIENIDDWAQAFTDNNNNVYWLTGESFDIDAENMYFKCILWPQTNTADDNSVWLKYTPGTTLPEPGSSLFKIDRTDSGNPVITDAGITVGALFINFDLYGGNYIFIKNDRTYVSNEMFGSNYQIDGDFLIDTTNNSYKVGYKVSGPEVVTDPNVTFTKGNVEEGYQTWTYDNIYFGTRALYTPTDSPAVGDSALFSLNDLDYNVQTIKTINTTGTPGHTDPVNCKLSYSVDGSTWTDWPENITDDNNVISNIPRYMYLKFSQDVVITVE